MKRLTTHLTPSTFIAFLALIFAVTGVSFAATGATGTGGGGGNKNNQNLVASTAKAKKKAPVKSTRGPAGPKGATGATGATGAAGATGPAGGPGPQGPQGNAGTNGTNGENGKEGSVGHEGKQGKEGKEGPPGAIHGQEPLPSKATETGAWVVGPAAAAGAVATSISFPIQLATPLSDSGCGEAKEPCQTHVIDVAGNEVTHPKEEHSKYCKGNAAAPTAEPGNLCVYEAVEEEAGFNPLLKAITEATNASEEGANQTGAVLTLAAREPNGTARGTWAVTAE
jgi:hypothetical protein